MDSPSIEQYRKAEQALWAHYGAEPTEHFLDLAKPKVHVRVQEGGEGAEFESDEDWVRAIRHGVDPEGKPIFMPAVVGFSHLSNEDLGAIIAFVKTVPPVDHETEERKFTVMANILFGLGAFGKLPAEVVSHNPNPSAPAAGVTVEYG